MIKVELLETMGGDLSIVNSARVSFSKAKDMIDDSDAKLIKYLAYHKHMTPFRHNAIKVLCKAPIFLARQLGKHQAGLSWNEVSRRYVDTPPEFYVPEEWRERPEGSVKQGSGNTHPNSLYWYQTYGNLVYDIQSIYNNMIEEGVAPEMARMILPQSMMTEWIWTGNLLAFAHIYNERIADNAQCEAQMFARMLGAAIEPHFPIGWEALRKE